MCFLLSHEHYRSIYDISSISYLGFYVVYSLTFFFRYLCINAHIFLHGYVHKTCVCFFFFSPEFFFRSKRRTNPGGALKVWILIELGLI